MEVQIDMKKVIALSGGFDPMHIGHVRMIQDAARLGSVHIYLNTDEWLMRKKGYVFMPLKDRAEILWGLKDVDLVIPASDADGTVCNSIEMMKPHMFGNGGDRTDKNTPEKELCERLGVEMVYNLGGDKIRSSSAMVSNAQA